MSYADKTLEAIAASGESPVLCRWAPKA